MLVPNGMYTGVVSSRPTEVRSSAITMQSRYWGAVPVIDDEQHLIGLVVFRDIMLSGQIRKIPWGRPPLPMPKKRMV